MQHQDTIIINLMPESSMSTKHGRIFRGGLGGFKPPQGRVNTPPENVETPPKKLETPPEISLIFNIPNYSLDYFTTMKLF